MLTGSEVQSSDEIVIDSGLDYKVSGNLYYDELQIYP